MTSQILKNKVIVILGPTASGKTALSLNLAKKVNGAIISADSCQIYKYMNIGTAKPTKKEMTNIPHYLINIKNPDEDYTVAEYKKDAVNAITKIIARGKTPIIVGGTGLYIQALVDNLDIPEVKPNLKLRKKLEQKIKKYGLQKLFDELVKLDPEAAYIVDAKNPRRVIRALEVAITTGKPFTSQRKKNKSLFDFLQIGIKVPDEELKQKIELRTKIMINKGLVQEVKKLIKKYDSKPRTFDSIGYKEIIEYLNGKITLKKAKELISLNTWHFAKRQMTWFKKYAKDAIWLKPNETKRAENLVKKFLEK
jgi:tRNA dimethylallyltransferase